MLDADLEVLDIDGVVDLERRYRERIPVVLVDDREVGAFAVAYAVAVGVFAYRELDWKRVNDALRHSVHDLGMIMLIIMLSAMIGYVISLEQVPAKAAEWIVGVTQNRHVLISMLVAFILLLGMVLEPIGAVLLILDELLRVRRTR